MMKYSVVVPIYNDGYLAEAFCEETHRVFAGILKTPAIASDLELIFINDGSPNGSLQTLIELTKRFDFVRVIDLSRNFGQHQALACGFREAQGRIVVRSNVDMQDPITELPKLLAPVENDDVDLAVGQYEVRQSPLMDRITSGAYFALFRFLSGLEVPHNTSPMRVMSRRFIDAYNGLTEKSRFPQGLDHWLGFRHALVTIEHRERADKRSSYTLRKRLRLALDGALYFSERPIQIVTVLGIILGFVGGLLGGAIVVTKLLGMEYLPGYASLAAIGLVTFGIQLASLGVIGLYVGKIFREVQNRPLYLIRDTYGRDAR